MRKCNHLEILMKSYLFSGIGNEEVEHLLKCLSVNEKAYGKDEILITAGEKISCIGIVLEGEAQIIHEDYWGNRIIFSELRESSVFGEVFAVLDRPSEVSVVATSPAKVLWLKISGLLTVCNQTCAYHNRLIKNLLVSISEKSLMLTRKMNHIGKKTTREKLLAYLSSESMKAGSAKFIIPFDRQDLADYLFVDRSALSSEISKLKKEGIIKNKKNEFEI